MKASFLSGLTLVALILGGCHCWLTPTRLDDVQRLVDLPLSSKAWWAYMGTRSGDHYFVRRAAVGSMPTQYFRVSEDLLTIADPMAFSRFEADWRPWPGQMTAISR